MKTKLNNETALHLAINYQGGEIAWCNELGSPIFAIDIRSAINAANCNTEGYGWDYDPLLVDVIRGHQLTRAEFRKEYSSYRQYPATNDKEKVEKMIKYGVISPEYGNRFDEEDVYPNDNF